MEGSELMNSRHHFYGASDEFYQNVWLEQLMDDYGESLTKLAFSYVKDWGKAQEVVQDVFVTCFDTYEKRDEIQSYKAWIYRITINRSKDSLRTSWFKRVIVQSLLFTYLKSDNLSPENQLIQNEKEGALANVVLSLPIKYREVILFYYYEDLSVKDISDLLKVNENTIKTRLKRARHLLKNELEGCDFNG